jgi:hypothetical protein
VNNCPLIAEYDTAFSTLPVLEKYIFTASLKKIPLLTCEGQRLFCFLKYFLFLMLAF